MGQVDTCSYTASMTLVLRSAHPVALGQTKKDSDDCPESTPLDRHGWRWFFALPHHNLCNLHTNGLWLAWACGPVATERLGDNDDGVSPPYCATRFAALLLE